MPLIQAVQAALTNQIPPDWQQIGQDLGFASTLYRIPLPNDQTAILKLWPAETEQQRTELRFYQSLADHAGIPTPKYLHGDHNQTHAVLILEVIEDATQGDCLQTSTPNQLNVLVHHLALFHARWWNQPVTAYPFIEQVPPLPPDQIQERAAIMLDRFANDLPELDQSILQNATHHYQTSFDQLQSHPKVVIHADFHLDNILFKTADDTPVIIDWSRVRQAPYLTNLAHVLFDMAPPEATQSLLDLYHQTLTNQNIPITGNQLSQDLQPTILFNFLQATLGTAHWHPQSPRHEQLIQDALRRRSLALKHWHNEQNKTQ